MKIISILTKVIIRAIIYSLPSFSFSTNISSRSTDIILQSVRRYPHLANNDTFIISIIIITRIAMKEIVTKSNAMVIMRVCAHIKIHKGSVIRISP